MLNMKLQYFGRFMRRTDSLEKTVMPEKTGKEEKGATENEMVGWHHRLNGHDFQQTTGRSKGRRSLACYSSWGHNELDTTEQLNNNNILT